MAKVNEAKAQAAKDCFGFNPALNTLYVTSDLACFADKNAAVNNARKLDDKDVDVFIRDGEEAIADADQTEDVTAETNTIPDFLAAQANKAAGAKVIDFQKTETPPIVATDADAAAIANALAPVINLGAVGDALPPVIEPNVDAAPVDAAQDENITDKITELVDEVETLLHLKDKKA